MLLTIILIGLLTGTLIGTVGVGGILLTPLLVFLLGTEMHIAQATSSFSFLFTGLVGVLVYTRRKSISWSHVIWISVGVIPAAFLGARVNTLLSSSALTIILALLIAFAGYNALAKQEYAGSNTPLMNIAVLVLIGVAVGFGSSLTGTGGPVLLVPLLLYLQFMPLLAVGISQAVQIPIAIFATAGYIVFGQIDFHLGFTLGVVQSVGVIVGATIAHALPSAQLRMVVAISLIGVGILMVARLFLIS